MTPTYRIPFNKPSLVGRELEYALDAIVRGHTAGDGAYTRRCQQLLESELHVPRVLLTTSCTHALEMAAMLAGIGPGDEVIVPSFTFVSTANAFALRGARPVFADVRRDTLNLDETRLEPLITDRTKAIVPVHYAGVGCEMDVILEIAARHGLVVIEDNAHGLYARYKGKYLGTFGQMGTQSFHETKNIICGEGGAILLNDERFAGRAEILREKGTDRKRFLRGQVDKYTWVDIGSSYVPSDILAAFLAAQLEKRHEIYARRREIWETYDRELADWAGENRLIRPFVPPHCEQAYHMYYLVLPSLEGRQRMIAHLAGRGMLAVFHYTPLHLSKMGASFGGQPGQCPVTEWASDRLLRLPMFNSMTPEEQTSVIDAVKDFQC
jgi:dTDP-4-amino-4,6-dideoxygalactose transaminase